MKKADGYLVQPGSHPEWLTPQKGKAINAPVNEEQPEESRPAARPGRGRSWASGPTSGTPGALNAAMSTASGVRYRLRVQLDDGTGHYVVVAVK